MDLQEFSKKLITYGFRVWCYRDRDWSELFAAIDGKLGYISLIPLSQPVYYSVIDGRIGAASKPPAGMCTYFTVAVTGMMDGKSCLWHTGEPSIELMRRCCDCLVPEWARQYDHNVQRWDLDTWRKDHPHLVEIT